MARRTVAPGQGIGCPPVRITKYSDESLRERRTQKEFAPPFTAALEENP